MHSVITIHYVIVLRNKLHLLASLSCVCVTFKPFIVTYDKTEECTMYAKKLIQSLSNCNAPSLALLVVGAL